MSRALTMSSMRVTDSAVPYSREVSIPGAQRLRLHLTFDGPCAEAGAERRCFQVIDLRARDLDLAPERKP